MNSANVVKRCTTTIGQSLRNVAPAAKRLGTPLAVGATVLSFAGGARAAGEFDPGPIVTVITAGVTSISAIGMAVISLVVVIKLFKWAQRVL